MGVQYHFTGDETARLREDAQAALQNVQAAIATSADDIKRFRAQIDDIKRSSWVARFFGTEETTALENEIDELWMSQNVRNIVVIKLKTLLEQLKLDPTSVSLDTGTAGAVQYWRTK